MATHRVLTGCYTPKYVVVIYGESATESCVRGRRQSEPISTIIPQDDDDDNVNNDRFRAQSRLDATVRENSACLPRDVLKKAVVSLGEAERRFSSDSCARNPATL